MEVDEGKEVTEGEARGQKTAEITSVADQIKCRKVPQASSFLQKISRLCGCSFGFLAPLSLWLRVPLPIQCHKIE